MANIKYASYIDEITDEYIDVVVLTDIGIAFGGRCFRTDSKVVFQVIPCPHGDVVYHHPIIRIVRYDIMSIDGFLCEVQDILRDTAISEYSNVVDGFEDVATRIKYPFGCIDILRKGDMRLYILSDVTDHGDNIHIEKVRIDRKVSLENDHDLEYYGKGAFAPIYVSGDDETTIMCQISYPRFPTDLIYQKE